MFKKFLNISGIVISIIVLLICVTTIGWVWLRGFGLAAAAVRLIEGTEQVLTSTQNGLALVRDGLTNFDETVIAVANTIDQVNDGVQEQGAIMLVLPAEKQIQLENLLSTTQTTFKTTRATLDGISDILDGLNRMPFVDIQLLDTEQLEKVNSGFTLIETTFNTLQSAIDQLDQGVSDTLTQASTAVLTLGSTSQEIQVEIDRVSEQITTIQNVLQSLRTILPTGFLIFAILNSLLLIWVCYTQIYMVRALLEDNKALNASDSVTA